MLLIHQLEILLRDAIHQALGVADADPLLSPAKNTRFGDYQANAAMGLAKQLQQKPHDLAQKIIDAMDAPNLLSEVSIAGPGFINLRINNETLAQQAADMLVDSKLNLSPAKPSQRVVVDYSSPNVAKEMHVGHLRSTVIGDCIARVLDCLGHTVIRQNHVGDWGTQFGMLIEHLLEVFNDETISGLSFDIGDLNTFYQEAKQKYDADTDFAERARKRVVLLQGGDSDTYELWRTLYVKSLEHFGDAYDRLGVLLTDDDIRGESSYNDNLPGVIRELEKVDLLKESEGATVVYPEGFVGKDGDPMPMIVRKSDGGYLYATTDLAAARYRINDLSADRIIYVTDARQGQHFAMIFQTLRQAHWASQTVRLDHVAFGTVLGRDRKPFKTRAGGTVKLADLLDEAERRAAKVMAAKNPDLAIEDQKAIAHTVAIGALKYADLSSDRIKDYVFDWDRMLALEGNTAPYLQNAYVRIRSIFRKAETDAAAVDAKAIAIVEDAERRLSLKLLQFPQVVEVVADSLEPHRLCGYLYELAGAFHQFYERCPVLKAEESVRDSRLGLCALTARTLKKGLDLLGIHVTERM